MRSNSAVLSKPASSDPGRGGAPADADRLDLPTRLRRNRRSEWARRMVQRTSSH